ncbi:MAG: cyclic nucleotide-binding domain-containing protein [Myxococcota bacterium]|nr:cyclic nucleotide-binding domain-containing protein [Myxococcota bacterium]
MMSEKVESLAISLSEHARAILDEPEDYGHRRRLALSLVTHGYGLMGFRLFRILGEQLLEQGHTLHALACLCEATKASGGDQPGIHRLVQELYQRMNNFEAAMEVGDLSQPLSGAKLAGQVVSPEKWDGFTSEQMVEMGFRIAVVPPQFACRGLPIPIPMLAELSLENFLRVVSRLEIGVIGGGENLVVQGEASDSMFLIVSGAVNVYRGSTRVARLGPGCVVGEMALLTDEPRSATIGVTSDMEYLELARKDVLQMAATSESMAEELRLSCHNRLLQNVVRTSALFKKLDLATGSLLIKKFNSRSLEPGEKLVEMGVPGEGVWVIANGKVSIRTLDICGTMNEVAQLGSGEVVGEISVLKGGPTTADVIALTKVWALFLERDTFLAVVKKHDAFESYLASLSEVRLEQLRSQ